MEHADPPLPPSSNTHPAPRPTHQRPGSPTRRERRWEGGARRRRRSDDGWEDAAAARLEAPRRHVLVLDTGHDTHTPRSSGGVEPLCLSAPQDLKSCLVTGRAQSCIFCGPFDALARPPRKGRSKHPRALLSQPPYTRTCLVSTAARARSPRSNPIHSKLELSSCCVVGWLAGCCVVGCCCWLLLPSAIGPRRGDRASVERYPTQTVRQNNNERALPGFFPARTLRPTATEMTNCNALFGNHGRARATPKTRRPQNTREYPGYLAVCRAKRGAAAIGTNCTPPGRTWRRFACFLARRDR